MPRKMRVTGRPRYMLLLPEFVPDSYYLSIDMGTIPRRLSVQLGWEVWIASEQQHDALPDGMRSLGYGSGRLDSLRCIWRMAPETDVLQLMHLTWRTVLRAALYRFRNPRGVCWVKLDLGEPAMRDLEALARRLPWRLFFRLGLGTADLISAESSPMQARFERFLARCGRGHTPEIVLLPSCGFDLDAVAERMRVARSKRFDILYVGRIGAWQKATDVLLDAFRLLRETYGVSARLTLIGQVDSRFQPIWDAWTARAESATVGSVTVHPPIRRREALMDAYLDAGVFVIPSRFEGIPNVLLEAASCGCIIVGTAVGQVPDVLRPGGRGWVVPVDDPVALGQALAKAIHLSDTAQDRWRRIQDFGGESSWPSTIARLGCLLEDARRRRGGRLAPSGGVEAEPGGRE